MKSRCSATITNFQRYTVRTWLIKVRATSSAIFSKSMTPISSNKDLPGRNKGLPPNNSKSKLHIPIRLFQSHYSLFLLFDICIEQLLIYILYIHINLLLGFEFQKCKALGFYALISAIAVEWKSNQSSVVVGVGIRLQYWRGGWIWRLRVRKPTGQCWPSSAWRWRWKWRWRSRLRRLWGRGWQSLAAIRVHLFSTSANADHFNTQLQWAAHPDQLKCSGIARVSPRAGS